MIRLLMGQRLMQIAGRNHDKITVLDRIYGVTNKIGDAAGC